MSIATGTIFAQVPPAPPKKLDPHIRISFIQPHPAITTGAIVPPGQMTNYLFTQEPCPVNIPDHTGPIHLALVARPQNLTGCWYPTTNDGFEIVLSNGMRQQGLLTQFPRAMLQPDGGAQITEPNYNSDTFASLANEKHNASIPARAVRFFAVAGGRIDLPQHAFVTGDRVPATNINTILFVDEPCSLPLADAKNMRRAWMAYGAYQLGCWYPTVDDEYVFVGQLPSLTHASGVPWAGLPRGLLYADGSVKITEPNYNSNTFTSDIIGKKAMSVFDHQHEKP